MKKIIIALALALSMVVTCVSVPTVSYAAQAASGTISPLAIISTSISFTASSNTKAAASVNATSSITPDSITSTIYLQLAPLNSSTFTTVSSVDPEIKTVSNKSSITHKCTFPVSKNKEYRIKVVLTEMQDGIAKQYTYYKNL